VATITPSSLPFKFLSARKVCGERVGPLKPHLTRRSQSHHAAVSWGASGTPTRCFLPDAAPAALPPRGPFLRTILCDGGTRQVRPGPPLLTRTSGALTTRELRSSDFGASSHHSKALVTNPRKKSDVIHEQFFEHARRRLQEKHTSSTSRSLDSRIGHSSGRTEQRAASGQDFPFIFPP